VEFLTKPIGIIVEAKSFLFFQTTQGCGPVVNKVG